MTSKVALIMGVANPRSIAWSCVERFVAQGWKVIFTCQSEKVLSKTRQNQWMRMNMQMGGDTNCIQSNNGNTNINASENNKNILGGFVCDVTTDFDQDSTTSNFRQQLADHLGEGSMTNGTNEPLMLSAVVHSIGFAPNIKSTPLLDCRREDFLVAQEVSSFSLVQVARETQSFLRMPQRESSTSNKISSNSSSITTLSYLGGVRAIPGYHAMGPAKASLESVVRGLALELASSREGHCPIRVNAVSAGPLPTLSAKGGISGFDKMRQDMEVRAPLGNISTEHVASTMEFLSSSAAQGITGQTIYVDGGYSIVGGPIDTDR